MRFTNYLHGVPLGRDMMKGDTLYVGDEAHTKPDRCPFCYCAKTSTAGTYDCGFSGTYRDLVSKQIIYVDTACTCHPTGLMRYNGGQPNTDGGSVLRARLALKAAPDADLEFLKICGLIAEPMKKGMFLWKPETKHVPNSYCPYCLDRSYSCGFSAGWADASDQLIYKIVSPCRKFTGKLALYKGANYSQDILVGRAFYTKYDFPVQVVQELITLNKKEVTKPPAKKSRGPHMCNCAKEVVVHHGCRCNGL